jgi:small subunit ribosomal protein S7
MRSRTKANRPTVADPVYGSVKITKLVNYVMRDGKKTVAEKQVYAALTQLSEQLKKGPVEAFDEVIDSLTPQMEVRSRRVGGAAYQVPMPVRPHRGFSLSIRWIVQEARKRSNSQYHTFAEKLVAEMLDILNNQGGAMQRKATSHRMAEANKAFAHFRW